MRNLSEFDRIRTYLIHQSSILIAFFVSIIVFFSCNTSYSQQFPDCLRCHKDKVAGKYDHPVKCVACHATAHRTGMKKKFPRYLFAQGVDLCWGCHDKTKFMGKVEHPPVAKGECLSCHDVHTTDYKSLIPEPMPEFCFKCHDNADFVRKSKHSPIAEGNCMGCHDAHKSNVRKLLLAEMPKECFLCHNRERYISDAKKEHHSPVATGRCLDCHEPHSSDVSNLLIKATPDVCFMCHYNLNFQGKYDHVPVATGACMSCHEPHQGDVRKLLLSKPPDLCFKCHGKEEFTRKDAHPPVSAGMCNVCHEPHASPDIALLYYPVNVGCLMCHPKVGHSPHAAGGVLQAGHPLEGRKDPSSKYGELSCASCHEPHSADYIDLFRYPAKTAFDLCKACHNYGAKSKN